MIVPARRTLVIFSSIVLAVLTACWGPGSEAVSEADVATTRLVFLNVGQGDAAVIISPEGRSALIDAGPSGQNIVGQLRRHGVDTVDVAIATHPHADHIGGFAEVFAALPVRYYMDNGVPHTTRTYLDLLQVIEASRVTYLEAAQRTLNLGSVRLRVLAPPKEAGSLNNGSIGVIVEFGRFRSLLTGDSETEELNHFMHLGVPDVDVLKAAHHGARDGVTPAWLTATRPEVVVISCGRGNPYGHPDPWAVRYYETAASQLYRTDLDGEVIVVVQEEGEYAVITERERNLARHHR